MGSVPGSKRIRLTGWFLILLVWVAGLGVCELLARHFARFKIIDGRLTTVEPHVEYGGIRIESLDGVAVWRRDHPDRPTPSPVKRGFRIVVLGDSVLEPARLDDRQGAARLLEDELNKRLDEGPYEVVNLSEGGWNSTQEERVFLHEGLPLAPDLVLVGVSPNDDQEFVFRDGQLFEVGFLRDLDRSGGGLLGFFAKRSYLYNVIWLRWESAEYAAQLVKEPRELESIVKPLQQIKSRAAEHGARFAVLCFPYLRGERFDPLVDQCEFQRLVGWALKENVPLLDPVSAYSHYPKRDLRLDHIHLSELGHRVLANATFDWLVALRLVPYDRILPAGAD